MIASLYLSFTDYRAVTPPTWIGLANFERMIVDRYFWDCCKTPSTIHS